MNSVKFIFLLLLCFSQPVFAGTSFSSCSELLESDAPSFYSSVVDMRREVGFDKFGNPTTKLMIVVDKQGLVRTAYPIELGKMQ